MKEDVEMTELALAFPLFSDSDNGTSLGKRHQVKFIGLGHLHIVFAELDTFYHIVFADWDAF